MSRGFESTECGQRSVVDRGQPNSSTAYCSLFEQELDQCEHELFFDMDVNIPSEWNAPFPAQGQGIHQSDPCNSVAEESNDGDPHAFRGQDFEFHIAYSSTLSNRYDWLETISPADELFFKGQLLPLHLPPRLQMVELLSSSEEKPSEDCDCSVQDESKVNPTSLAPKLLEGVESDCDQTGDPIVGLGKMTMPDCLTMVTSRRRYIYVRKEEEESNVFPFCYKDPPLHLLKGNVLRFGASLPVQVGRCKSSVGFSLLFPSLGVQNFGMWQENYPYGLEFRRAMKPKKSAFSMLKSRFPSSCLKSFSSVKHLKGSAAHQREICNGQRSSCPGGTADEKHDQPSMSTKTSAQEKGSNAADVNVGEKVSKKSKGHLYKFVKSMHHVLFPRRHLEQSTNVSESSTITSTYASALSSLGAASSFSTSSSTSSSLHSSSPSLTLSSSALSWSSSSTCSSGKAESQLSLTDKESDLSLTGTAMKSSGMPSFGKRSFYANGIANSSLGDCDGGSVMTSAASQDSRSFGAPNVVPRSTCGWFTPSLNDPEDPIKGAIAHCKRSASVLT
ncbi:hypothetical protein KP509_15G053900 [Ceratopteris richardii]|uniref:Uncharacterized protein n=1 Tax=Ceratopteris richardii TaxID=49495 RepID=A0A8T2T3E2_CERRI|nr:hypothetical protein KP509_15G053900 [Ceratopteris richardii]